MRDLNSVSITGRLGGNPEIRYGTTGNPNTTYNVAVSDDYKEKDGGWVTRTYWITVREWRENARLAKGDMVAIKGKLVNYKGTDNKSYYYIDADQVVRLNASANSGIQNPVNDEPISQGNGTPPASGQNNQQAPPVNQNQSPAPSPNSNNDYNPDDDGVPF
jgi:single-strand DNA-binding protein